MVGRALVADLSMAKSNLLVSAALPVKPRVLSTMGLSHPSRVWSQLWLCPRRVAGVVAMEETSEMTLWQNLRTLDRLQEKAQTSSSPLCPTTRLVLALVTKWVETDYLLCCSSIQHEENVVPSQLMPSPDRCSPRYKRRQVCLLHGEPRDWKGS